MARAAVSTARRPSAGGRPRSQDRSDAVLAATLDVLVERGISGMAIEAVAQRAGVSKVTIYRRWPDKVALVLAALDTLPELEVPDTGSLLGDLVALRRTLLQAVAGSRLGDVIPALMAERRRSDHHDAIGSYIDERTRPFLTIVERSVARDEIRPAMPVALLAHMLSSPLGMSLMTRDTPLTDDDWTTVVTTILRGITTEGNVT